MLADQLRTRRIILAYSRDGAALAWRYPNLEPDLRRAIRNRRRSLAQMMLQGDHRLCPAPDLHRHSWTYQGDGRYYCEVCRRIDAHQVSDRAG